MNREDAIRTLMVGDWRPENCVDLSCKYISLVRGEVFPYPKQEKELTMAAVRRVLGNSPKRKGEYGDLFLCDSGLGINLGYSAVQFSEEHDTVVFEDLPEKRLVFWSPSNG